MYEDTIVEPAGPVGYRRIGRALAARERLLWTVALVALLADLVLTYYGLGRGFSEGNPIARVVMARFGFAALGVLKGLALAVGVAGWLVLPRRVQAVVPLALALPWTLAVLSNVVLLLFF